MKAINLIKNNIFTLLKSGCSNNEIYEAIKELEDLQEYLDEVKDCGWCKEHRAIIQWDKTDPRKNR